MKKDALDEMIAERAARNPDFPKMVQEAIARRERARQDPPNEPEQETTSVSKVGVRMRQLSTQARNLADRRKHKTPA